MRVAVVGIGYLGMVQTVCLARAGLAVAATDQSLVKNRMLREGQPTVVEPGLREALALARSSIEVFDDPVEAMRGADAVYVCVGTPPGEGGSVDLVPLFRVAEDVARAVAVAGHRMVVIIRSTLPVGATRRFVEAVERRSGRPAGDAFGVAVQPEFLREGSGLADFLDPVHSVLGVADPRDAAVASEIHARVGIRQPLVALSFAEAELFKLLNNAFHATKIAFANEAARIGKRFDLDAVELMRLLALDRRLNVSPEYLVPGMPFGGYCLPKDTLGLRWLLETERVEAAGLAALTTSNEEHHRFVASAIQDLLSTRGHTRDCVGLVGIAFKRGVDDLRESPYLRLFSALRSHGYDVRFYDPLLDPGAIVGTNRTYVESLCENLFAHRDLDPDAFLSRAKAVLVGCGNGLEDLLSRSARLAGKTVVSLNPGLDAELRRAGVDFESFL